MKSQQRDLLIFAGVIAGIALLNAQSPAGAQPAPAGGPIPISPIPGGWSYGPPAPPVVLPVAGVCPTGMIVCWVSSPVVRANDPSTYPRQVCRWPDPRFGGSCGPRIY
jgi:hypothetical protein